MFNKVLRPIIVFVITFFYICFPVNGEIIKNIEISGNERIADETILMFSKINVGSEVDEQTANEILKNLYDTNFFKNVSVFLKNNKVSITVVENPIIETITYNGVKSNELKGKIISDLKLKPRSSYNEVLLKKDKEKMQTALRDIGYYFSNVDEFLRDVR